MANNLPILQVAAKAAIVNKMGEVLIVREAQTGKNNTKVGLYGLVGGRLDPGETFYDGLAREVLEETGLTATPLAPLYVGEWHPVIRGQEHQIIAIFMLCRATAGGVRLSAEHDDYKWVKPGAVGVPMMQPDGMVADEKIVEALKLISKLQ
jgi:8-oxo-dGTP diphosphatase